MFEKEAKDYSISSKVDYINNIAITLVQRAFKDGAEFGYNKAKEELERRIASQRGTIRVYNNKLKARLEQVERLKQENKKLTKAKEIIKKFLEFVNNEVEFDPEHPQEHTDLWNELCEQAEQFLRKSE